MTHLAPLRFRFDKVAGYAGRYLLKNLHLAFHLGDEEHSVCEEFALDTGSPFTVLRQSVVERMVGDLAEYDLQTIGISGYGDEDERAPVIEDVCVSAGGGTFTHSVERMAVTPRINNKKFSLLGTEFLEQFEMFFDPAQGFALLVPKQIRMADEIGEHYVEIALYGAITDLREQDSKLLELDVGERTVTQHLAKHLQRYFPGWNVDCEYNRVGDVPGEVRKALPETRADKAREEEPGERTVFPDIIVHQRGNEAANLLVIEVKKQGREGEDDDVKKLHLYEDKLGYQHAYFIALPTGIGFDCSSDVVKRIHD